MRRALFLLLGIVFVTGLCFAEETNPGEGKGQDMEDLSSVSTLDLEKRLDKVKQDISELEAEADYLKTEEPQEFDVSPREIERTGYEEEDTPKSELLNPQAERDTHKQLKRLYEVRKEIEAELDKRYKQ